jgi:hypothetical protein
MLSDLRGRVALITADLSAIAQRMRDCAKAMKGYVEIGG